MGSYQQCTNNGSYRHSEFDIDLNHFIYKNNPRVNIWKTTIMNIIPVDCILMIFNYLDANSSYNYYTFLLKHNRSAIIDIDRYYKIKTINKKELINIIKINNTDLLKYILRFFKYFKIIGKYIIIFGSNFILLKLIEENKSFLTYYKNNYKNKFKKSKLINDRIKTDYTM